jgi:hypothetical protein
LSYDRDKTSLKEFISEKIVLHVDRRNGDILAQRMLWQGVIRPSPNVAPIHSRGWQDQT